MLFVEYMVEIENNNISFFITEYLWLNKAKNNYSEFVVWYRNIILKWMLNLATLILACMIPRALDGKKKKPMFNKERKII